MMLYCSGYRGNFLILLGRIRSQNRDFWKVLLNRARHRDGCTYKQCQKGKNNNIVNCVLLILSNKSLTSMLQTCINDYYLVHVLFAFNPFFVLNQVEKLLI